MAYEGSQEETATVPGESQQQAVRVHEVHIFKDDNGTLRVWPPYVFANRSDKLTWRNSTPNAVTVSCASKVFPDLSLAGGKKGGRDVDPNATGGAHVYRVDDGAQRAIGNSAPEIIIE